MRVVDDLAKANLKQGTILTIGVFDGVHRGHQALIRGVVERARATNRLAALITFHPHPAVIRAPERAPRYLTAPGEKLALLEGLGVDLVALLPFDRALADTTARSFMEKVARHLCPRELWVGEDFHLGRDREGDVSCLRELGRELGYEVIVFEAVSGGEQAISSSRIRSLFREGRIEEAAALLGRNPGLSGKAAPGLIPARLEVDPARALPADGVYAAVAVLGGERIPALASIGAAPDSEGDGRSVEVRLLDRDMEMHGRDLTVELVSWLGDEPVAQLEIDRQATRAVLSRAEEKAGRHDPPPEEPRYQFREQEHTADRALRVWGRELANLFEGAALGMCSLMGDPEGLVPQVWHTLRLDAGDREALLVEWLNELLFLIEQEGLLFTDFYVESLHDATGRAQADLGTATMVARAGGAVAPITGAHIKAATFHDLTLVEDETGWSAVITFDV